MSSTFEEGKESLVFRGYSCKGGFGPADLF